MPKIDGWEDVLCMDDKELPQLFYQFKLPREDNKPLESLSLHEKGGLWHLKKYPNSEVIANGVPYCEADRILFKALNIHLPAPEKMSKYGVRGG